MSHLLREHAPITEAGWKLIDEEARERLLPGLAARRLVDFSGPHGWELSATNLGRVERANVSEQKGVEAHRRVVLPLVELRSRDAVRRLLWHPGELGAAQAYVTGDIEVHHDLDAALTHVWAVAAERGLSGVRPSPGAFARALRTALGVGAAGRPPALPASQARVRGRLHSKLRDRRAISHHYDLSNEFYSLILEPQMAYSSAYFRSEDPSYTLEDAQRDKLDLVCTKLGLAPSMRFLDIGCGWGSLSLHAAEHYGVQVTGVTIAAEQKKFIDQRVHERGLSDRVEIRLQDADYKMKLIPSFSLSNLSLNPNVTIMQEAASVRGGKWEKKIEMNKDPGMYSFTAPKYTVTFWFNPSNTNDCPPNVQDRFGWLGEGITDKKYLDTSGVLPGDILGAVPGLRYVKKTITLTREDLLGTGEKTFKVSTTN